VINALPYDVVAADIQSDFAGRSASSASHIELFSQGFAVQDLFLSPNRVAELLVSMQERRGRGEFSAARIGAESRLRRLEEVRGDFTCWIAPPLLSAEQHLLADLEQLRLQLNAEGQLGLFDLELHYANYPPGASYARHVDQPLGREQRVLSFALYLNTEWLPADGGELRLFMPDGTYRDIAPIGGRLVYFLTAGREHAVLCTQRARSSITGWFRRR
jgi:SM-20-related protein